MAVNSDNKQQKNNRKIINPILLIYRLYFDLTKLF